MTESNDDELVKSSNLVRQDKPLRIMTPDEYRRDCMTFGSHEFQMVEEVKGEPDSEPDSEAVYVWKLPGPSNA